MTNKEFIKGLPGDLPELVELIGLDATLRIVDRFGGVYLNIPKCTSLLTQKRNAEIKALYATNKWTRRELSLKYGICQRQIDTVLSSNDEIPQNQLNLFQMNK